MKPIARLLAPATLVLALALGGCGKSDKATDAASADNVEMPAEEALGGVAGVPTADPSALATDVADQASSAANEAVSAADSASAAASSAVSAPPAVKPSAPAPAAAAPPAKKP